MAVSRICPTFAVTTGQSTIVDVATQKTGRSLAQNGRTLFPVSLLLQRPSTSRTILLRFNFSTNILARIMCVSETSVKQNLYLLKKKWAWVKRMSLFENSYRSFRTKHLQNKKNAAKIEEDKYLFDSEVLPITASGSNHRKRYDKKVM